MKHPPYSPDLAQFDLLLFSKVMTEFKGTRFDSVDAVKAKPMQLLNSITHEDMQHRF